uniref:Glycosyltransferase 61 catalytic domain-containing protein n=1 Tax=Leersia perrieri TaxID=77586 RepID=A0A0D9XEM4_9ORYZ
MKKSSNAHHKHVKGSLCLIPPLLLAVLFYLQFQTLGFFSSIFPCGAGQSAAAGDYIDRLRASATFLPLKDTREWAEAWFISNVGDTSEPEGEAKNIFFPSPVTDGRLLCLSAPSRRDGTKNAYALAWRDALPDDAELRTGLAYVSETAYDHSNLWHGISALIPFASWHARGVCEGRGRRETTPARWALFHHGEVRLGMSPWLTSLAEATTGVDMVVETFNASYTPVCFEEAVVFRRNMAGMTRERLLAAFDFMRCKARAQCGVVDGGDPSVVNVTILFRTGARAFKDEAAVTRVFQNECARVAGCKLTTARSDNLTFCDQVRLMSGTDVLISSHGAQMTNLVFMERNSSIMEFYPKGWRERAGGGQFVYRWGADRAGMRHEGSWWDPNGEPCPNSPDILSCYKNRQIGHDEAYFAQWAAKVFAANKERKAGLAAGVAASTRQREATTTCCS